MPTHAARDKLRRAQGLFEQADRPTERDAYREALRMKEATCEQLERRALEDERTPATPTRAAFVQQLKEAHASAAAKRDMSQHALRRAEDARALAA